LFVKLLQIIPFQCSCKNTELINKDPEDKISILLINVHTSNQKYDLTKNYIEKVKPDILVLEEINKKWFSELLPEKKI